MVFCQESQTQCRSRSANQLCFLDGSLNAKHNLQGNNCSHSSQEGFVQRGRFVNFAFSPSWNCDAFLFWQIQPFGVGDCNMAGYNFCLGPDGKNGCFSLGERSREHHQQKRISLCCLYLFHRSVFRNTCNVMIQLRAGYFQSKAYFACKQTCVCKVFVPACHTKQGTQFHWA